MHSFPQSAETTSNFPAVCGRSTLNVLYSTLKVQLGKQALCLVCNDTNSTFKRSILNGHFDAKHGHRYILHRWSAENWSCLRVDAVFGLTAVPFEGLDLQNLTLMSGALAKSYEVSLLLQENACLHWCRLCNDCILAAVDDIFPGERFQSNLAIFPHCYLMRGRLGLWRTILNLHEVQNSQCILHRLGRELWY